MLLVTLIETCPPNYKFYQATRQSGRGGGIAAIISAQFVCGDIDLGTFPSFEYLAIEFKTTPSNQCDIVSAAKVLTTFHTGIFRTDIDLHYQT